MALDLQHQTAAQFVTRFREAYRTADKDRCAKLASWLYDRWAAGDITTAQIRNAFNLDTQTKWDAFRVKISAMRDAWLSVQGAKGE
jgi:hypothetical protein